MIFRIMMAALLPLIAIVCHADDMLVKDTGEVRILYHSWHESRLPKVVTALDLVRQEIRNDLGITFTKPVEVVLAGGRKEFSEYAGKDIPGWALAIAHTKQRGIVVDMSLTTTSLENSLTLTLEHELVHLALGEVEHETGRDFPSWFHEGVAVRLSGGRHFSSRKAFELAAEHGSLIPLKRITEGFPSQAADAELAYLEAEDFVNYLAAKCPDHRLVDVIAHIRQGQTLAQAIETTTGASVDSLEKDWRDSYKSGHPWLRTLWHAITLFGMIAVLVIIIYLIITWRKRRKLREWLKEEEITAAAYEDEDEDESFEELPDRKKPWEKDNEEEW
jgi:hypothetical protein